jgi:hypothetical protein
MTLHPSKRHIMTFLMTISIILSTKCSGTEVGDLKIIEMVKKKSDNAH